MEKECNFIKIVPFSTNTLLVGVQIDEQTANSAPQNLLNRIKEEMSFKELHICQPANKNNMYLIARLAIPVKMTDMAALATLGTEVNNLLIKIIECLKTLCTVDEIQKRINNIFKDFKPEKPKMFKVILEEPGANKLLTVKLIKETCTNSLVEAKQIVDSAPVVLREGISFLEAETLKNQIEQSGSRVTIKNTNCYDN